MRFSLAALLLVAGPVAWAEGPADSARVDFVRDVRPILVKHCAACHGADEQKSGLRLDAGSLVHRGGDQGGAVVPGKSAESMLIKVVSGGGDIPRMPLDEEPLAAAQISVRERWARHWLDVARYADSHGYTIDGPRSIWPYRDWVIDALNRDLPFDQFTIQQIAGDMLREEADPRATLAQVVATGFHRNTLVNQ